MPTLSWVGSGEYVFDGLDPESGHADTTLVFKVVYTDLDGHAPATGDPELHINLDGNEIDGSPFTMTLDSWVGDHFDHSQGSVYRYECRLDEGEYAYHFTATDNTGEVANATQEVKGPEIERPDTTGGDDDSSPGLVTVVGAIVLVAMTRHARTRRK